MPNVNAREKSLTQNDAELIAQNFLELNGNEHKMTILPDKTRKEVFGFVFFYAPKKYIETKDISYLVPGSGPLVIDKRNRKAIPLTTALHSEEAIKIFRNEWNKKILPMEKLNKN